MTAVQFDRVSRHYGEVKAVDDISFQIPSGEFFTLLGKEGCKTNGIENFDKVHFWRTPVSQCKSQGTCVPYYRWVSDYIAILGGR